MAHSTDILFGRSDVAACRPRAANWAIRTQAGRIDC